MRNHCLYIFSSFALRVLKEMPESIYKDVIKSLPVIPPLPPGCLDPINSRMLLISKRNRCWTRIWRDVSWLWAHGADISLDYIII